MALWLCGFVALGLLPQSAPRKLANPFWSYKRQAPTLPRTAPTLALGGLVPVRRDNNLPLLLLLQGRTCYRPVDSAIGRVTTMGSFHANLIPRCNQRIPPPFTVPGIDLNQCWRLACEKLSQKVTSYLPATLLHHSEPAATMPAVSKLWAMLPSSTYRHKPIGVFVACMPF